jgi:hypothetical protein
LHPNGGSARIRIGSPEDAAMNATTPLKLLFGFIFISLLGWTTYASSQQPVMQWGGLTSLPDKYWTIATLIDAYYGFLTFYVWVLFKERRALPRLGWFVAIMLLGNMAMSAYVLIQLWRLKPGQPASDILTARA